MLKVSNIIPTSMSVVPIKLVATTSCDCQGVWMRTVLPLSYPIMHKRNKHIDVKFHFLHDMTKYGAIDLKHWVTL